MTDYEIQQLQLSQQIFDRLGQINGNVISVNESVYDSVRKTQVLSDKVSHLADQADLVHMTLYSLGIYIMVGAVTIILCAALLMYLVGYKVSRGS